MAVWSPARNPGTVGQVSNPEGFLSEVADEVRRDRMYRLWRRYGPWVIGAIVLVVAAGAGWEWREQAAEDAARARMEEYLAAARDESPTDSAAALIRFADRSETAGEAGYALLARMLAGARLLEAGDMAGAAAAYRDVAADPETPPAFRGLAELRALMAEAGDTPPAELAEQLRALTGDSQLYRQVAGELRVNALLAAEDDATVVAEVETLLEQPDLSHGMRARLEAMRRAAEERSGGGGDPG